MPQSRTTLDDRTLVLMHWVLLAGFIAAHVVAYIVVFVICEYSQRFAVVFVAVAASFARGSIDFARLWEGEAWSAKPAVRKPAV